jgi:hypothetical protein
MNRYWGGLTRLLTFFVRRVPFYRHVLHAPDSTLALLDGGAPVIFAVVHQDIFATFNALPRVLPRRPLTAMVSLSRDGGLAALGLEALGYEVARGSSSRGGGEGLLTLKSRVAAGVSVLMVCDGPKGPLGDVKEGIVRLASTTRAPIVPVRSWAQLQLLFRRSWTRAALPVPFQTVRVALGEPIAVPERCTEARAFQLRIARAIADLAADAQAWAHGIRARPFTVASD